MGRVREIRIETRVFQKAGDGTAFFSEMLNRYDIGSRVSETDGLDLSALLKRHDQYSEKVGVGIDHYKVDSAPEPYEGRCFWVVRVDGSSEDFSFGHCLKRKDGD